MKKLVVILVAALAALSNSAFAGTPNPKAYTISLSYAAKLGVNQLAPGDYKLAIDTASVRVIELKTGKAYEVAGKVETSEKKFDNTAITMQTVGGVAEIRRIRLGGTKIQIDLP
jgi:hypothetical protein